MKLPTELTRMIFDFYLAGYSLPDFREMFPRSPLLPEVTLSHVCQQWRKISLNYAKLWTRFCCIMELVKSIPDQITRFDTYIQRSGCQKLEIFLQFKDYGYNEDEPLSLTQLLSLALKQVERWKGVTLIGLPKNHSNILDCMESAKAPNLEYFLFSPGNSISSNDRSSETRPRMFLGDTPRLRYVLLDDLCNIWPPLNNITTLRIERPQVLYNYTRTEIHNDAILRDLLSIPSESLVNLSLVGSPSIPPTLKSSETIDMKSLKHLRYIFHPYMTHLLPFIRAPLLETLMIQHDDWEETHRLRSPFDNPSESYTFPSLETLTLIEAVPASSEEAFRFVQMTKFVKSILILHESDNDNYFDVLYEQGAFNDECWPSLSSITVNLPSRYYPARVEAVRDLVLSHRKDTLELHPFARTHLIWQRDSPDNYKVIQDNCTVEVVATKEKAEHPLNQLLWPPGVEYPNHAKGSFHLTDYCVRSVLDHN